MTTIKLDYYATPEHHAIKVKTGGQCPNCPVNHAHAGMWVCSCGFESGCSDCTSEHLKEHHKSAATPRAGRASWQSKATAIPMARIPFKFNREKFLAQQQQ